MKNQHKVPQKQWMKWSPKAREVFNDVYHFGMNNQSMMNHPKQEDDLKPSSWKTVCWNFAWLAADAIDDCIPDEIVSTDGSRKKVA